LTTINTLMLGELGVTTVADDINAAQTRVVATHPNFHLVDWNAALHAPDGVGLLQSDGVHPTPAGQLALAALVRNGVRHDCT
jgi:lysophospholipase L1-like esterase